MYKHVIQGIKSTNKREISIDDAKPNPESEVKQGIEMEDSKVELYEETIMDYVNHNRSFSNITKKDLKAVFLVLRKRCPKTWNQQLETHAMDFNEKVTKLRGGALNCFVDPEITKPVRSIIPDDKYCAKDLMINPQLWNMTRHRAIELRELLHHLTIFSPFEGKPFIRAWLEALVPCFARWILLSDTGDECVLTTLKYFLSAFGQPGIVVCLADKGAKVLQSLKESARSVEALGRGTVEQYYWKRLVESSFGKEQAWRELANLPNISLRLSQLDTLPENWLLDSGDWVHVFTNVVSPKITEHFGTVVRNIIDDVKLIDVSNVHPGPPKRLARSIAKTHEYLTEFNGSRHERWYLFKAKFKRMFGRYPSKPEDFVWNIMDFARCSIVLPSPSELLIVKERIEKTLEVVCVKNGYSSDYNVKGSGYRDLKLLVKVDFHNLDFKGIPKTDGKITMICEIQLLCETWLNNKLTTSLSYKVLRSKTLRDLLSDFSKYLAPLGCDRRLEKLIDATKVLKNGWVNLAKATDFSHIDENMSLIEACQNGWDVKGLEILVKKLGANIETEFERRTPVLWCSAHGHNDLLQKLINFKANIESTDSYKRTALYLAVSGRQEESVRLLLENKASSSSKSDNKETPIDIAIRNNYKCIEKLLRGEKPPIRKSSEKKQIGLMDMLTTAAIERSLADFFDTHDLEQSAISKLFASQAVVTENENILLCLWFGAEVDFVYDRGFTALCWAAKYGTVESLNLILEAGASVNFQKWDGYTPLHLAVKHKSPEMISVLLEAKADTELSTKKGWTPLHHAALYRGEKIISLLIKARANIHAKTNKGRDVLGIAKHYKNNVEEITRVIESSKSYEYSESNFC